MKTAFFTSFTRDLKKLKRKDVRERVAEIVEAVEAAAALDDLADVKKLAGTENCFRIRVGDFRIGVVLEQDTVAFARCLHRRDLYKYFP